MDTQKFIFNQSFTVAEGQFTAKAPSNIALVKYWGKTHPQLPKNASFSFSLSASFTETKLFFFPKNKTLNYDFEVFLDGVKNDDFKPKIQNFFENVAEYIPFIHSFRFEIHTHNSFPHSSGIASSASSFAALSLCLMQLEKSFSPEMSNSYFYQKAAFLARLGSGSATRSVKGSMVLWGEHPAFEGSSDLYGIEFSKDIHPIFHDFQDTILLVDKGQKKVSSSVGHNLMTDHPFAVNRFQQANTNIVLLIKAMQSGDLSTFIHLVETEALSLHAMMMTADSYFILMQPNTLAIIKQIWEFRNKTDIQVCFTLDAGANVHVLYPKNEADRVIKFIDNTLSKFCENNQYICDKVRD